MVKIIVARHYDGYKAFVGGDAGCWGYGPTAYAAVGNLVNAHRELFGVNVQWPEQPAESETTDDAR